MANNANAELHEAWGNFLGQYPWDWFLTLTFREPVPSFTAHNRFARFARDIDKTAGLPVAWFRADEYGPATGRLHIPRADAQHRGEGRALVLPLDATLGTSQLLCPHLPFDPTRAASFYCQIRHQSQRRLGCVRQPRRLQAATAGALRRQNSVEVTLPDLNSV